MRTKVVCFALGMAAVTATLAGQADSGRLPPDSGRTRVLSHTFVTPSREFVRVRLDAGVSYRAELEPGRVTLEVRPLAEGGPGPLLRDVRSRGGDEKGVEYDIEPRLTGDYEFRVLGAGDREIRLTLDRRTGTN